MDPKLEKLLLKARKGNNLSLKQTQMILDAVGGWAMERSLEWTKPSTVESNLWKPEDREFFLERFEKAKKELVSLSSKPKVGQRIIGEVSPIKETPGKIPLASYTITRYRGESVLRYTGPRRKTFTEYGENTFRFWKWAAEETDLLDQVNGLLDMEAHVPASQRTRDGTGTCPVCLGNYKLRGDGMVMHGYKRPPSWGGGRSLGVNMGRCFGVGHPPYELSDEGCKVFLKYLKHEAQQGQKKLTEMERGTVDEVLSPRDVRIDRTHKNWESFLAKAIKQQEYQLKTLQADIDRTETLIRKWKKKPLPSSIIGRVASRWLARRGL